MQYNFVYRGITKSEALESHVKEQLEKLSGFYGEDARVKVVFRQEKAKDICEITVIGMHDTVFRVEKYVKDDMYAAVTETVKGLTGLMRKYKAKIEKRRREKSKHKHQIAAVQQKVEEEQIRVKELILDSVDIEGAIDNMEQLGHDFYVFRDGDTGKTGVVYKRNVDKHGKNSFGVLLCE